MESSNGSAAQVASAAAATAPAAATATASAAAATASAAPAATAADALLALSRAGELVARYPLAVELTGKLSGAEFARAGQLLARLDPDEVLRANPGFPAVSVAITGHGTMWQLVPALTAELARHGLLLRPFVGDFDSYVFELSDPASRLYAANADLTVCVLDPMVVFDEVPVVWRPADVERVLAEKLRLIERLVGTFEATSRGTIVINTVPLPHRFAAQLLDYRSRRELGVIWREAGVRLLRLADDHPCLTVVDLDLLIAEGLPVTDPRLSAYAKAHLSPDLLARYARELGHLARQASGRTRKCLALDLDGTLWGGVLGEEGVAGIEVGEGRRGEAFRAFQQVIKQIGSQGVLLAVVSKNDLPLVREALGDTGRMTLAEDDFVRIVANWRPKHDNLTELAAVLNLGTDSFVFVDDSPLECGLVRSELPGVAVVQLDEEPALHVQKLLRDDWFGVRELTEEDRTRVTKYREELERKDFLDSFDSLEDYLRELNVAVRLAGAGEQDVARVSQLTLRTNQFNLTTQRLQQTAVSELLSDPGSLVLTVRSSDRFGDNGLVGAAFLRRDARDLHIDNFVLSCRVFSRGIEQACLAAILHRASSVGIESVYGTYRPSARNGVVRDFYPRYGFQQIGEDDTTLLFRHDLQESLDRPAHVSLDEDLVGSIW
jgi:FkbH-like protein